MCECEHAKHFSEGSRKAPLGHEYGEDRPAGVTVRTPFGDFKVCQGCADECYKKYPVVGGIQK